MKMIKDFLRKRIRNFIRGTVTELASDLELREKISATQSAAAYLTERMGAAKRFTSAREVLNYALASCTLEGAVLEFGVFQGGTIRIIAEHFPQKKVYGFDSFEGLPENWRPGFSKAAFDLKGQLPEVPANVSLIKGWFDQALPVWKAENAAMVSFLHIDCDLYSSTKTVFELLSDRIVAGTVIVFDEYLNYPGWETGEYQAFQEWISRTGLSYSYLAVNLRHEQVAVKIGGKIKP